VSDDLERLRARRDLYDALEDLEVAPSVRDEMVADPEAALKVLGGARQAKGVRNLAAFVTSRWKQYRARPRLPFQAPPPDPAEYVPGPPTLSALEYAWSRDPSPMMDALLAAMAASIGQHGGFEAMRPGFGSRQRFNADGELVSTDPA
jgi:hypothetical protein